MKNGLGAASVAVAMVLLGAGGVVLDRLAASGGARCGGTVEACRAPALAGNAAFPRNDGNGNGNDANRPRLLSFSSASCPACARMKPVLASIEHDCGAAKEITHVDVDAPPGEGLAASYGVTLLPTVLSVDARGREVARLTGVQPAETIERALEEVRGAKCATTETLAAPRAL